MYMSRNMMVDMMRLSSMKRINRAADDAAGLAISEKLVAQYRGTDRATTNIQEMKDLVRNAEGGMDSITSSLQRMRELVLQSGNAAYSDDERKAIQAEINQLKDGINKAAETTEYNSMKLLDGSFKDKFVTMNANGAGQKVSIDGLSAKSLGVDQVDVTVKGNLSENLTAISGALKEVVGERTKIGAVENKFDSAVRSGSNTYLNLLESKARIADMSYRDIGNAITSLNTSKILQQYRFFAMAQQNNIAGSFLNYML